jgi:competence protein CoiA
VPRCGAIVAWHWAHLSQADCDPWAERDSRWHSAWQETVPPERREIVMGPHRADLIAANGWVVELQHSSISAAEISEREGFYGRMVWLFDATACAGRLSIRHRAGQPYVTFRWMHPRKSVAACQRPVMLDLGGGWVMQVRRFHPQAPCGGWGYLASTEAVRSWMRDGESLAWIA